MISSSTGVEQSMVNFWLVFLAFPPFFGFYGGKKGVFHNFMLGMWGYNYLGRTEKLATKKT